MMEVHISVLVYLLHLHCQATGTNIRLVSPLNNGVGRLEVYYNGEWGTVCDDEFGTYSAVVACRQLGLSHQGSQPRAIQTFGYGSGKILLDDVKCTGTELSLSACPHSGWGTHNCGHHEDVGVICDDRGVTMKLSSSYRLGFVQVYHSGSWGTVCGDSFGQVEASVVCKALGYQSGEVITASSSSTSIWLDDVQCTMRDTDLKDCKHKPWGIHNCTPFDVIRVECYSFPQGYNIRIGFTSKAPGQGKLEMYYNGQWGNVCRDDFGEQEATVACRMLGYSTFGSSALSGFGSGTAKLKNVKCLGSESSLNDCLQEQSKSYTCSFVGIKCTYVRLASGDGKTHGRLELFYNNLWGTVNEDGFSNASASVVCRMLGQPHHKSHFTQAGQVYGEGTGPVWLTQVSCRGNESDIAECPHSSWGYPSSNHSTDVGVVCSYPPDIHLEPNTGRLEVFVGDEIRVRCATGVAHPPVTSYEWIHNSRRTNISDQSVFVTTALESTEGRITCIAHNGISSSDPNNATAIIDILYPPVLHCPETLHLAYGESKTVECLVSSNPPPNIDVVRGNTEGTQSVLAMHNGSSLSFQLPNVSEKDAGLYVITVRNTMTDYKGLVINGSSNSLITVNVFAEDLPQTSSTDMKLVAIVTGSVAVAVILVLIVALFWMQRRLKIREKKRNTETRSRTGRGVTNLTYIQGGENVQGDSGDIHVYEAIRRPCNNVDEPVYVNTEFSQT